jgi:hypothetical protein
VVPKIDVSAGKVMDCKGMRERELIPIWKNYLKVESRCYENAQSSLFPANTAIIFLAPALNN